MSSTPIPTPSVADSHRLLPRPGGNSPGGARYSNEMTLEEAEERLAAVLHAERAASERVRAMEIAYSHGQAVMLSAEEEVELNHSLARLRQEFKKRQEEMKDLAELHSLVKNELTQAQAAQGLIYEEQVRRKSEQEEETRAVLVRRDEAAGQLLALEEEGRVLSGKLEAGVQRLKEIHAALDASEVEEATLAQEVRRLQGEMRSAEGALSAQEKRWQELDTQQAQMTATVAVLTKSCEDMRKQKEKIEADTNHAAQEHDRVLDILEATEDSLALLEARKLAMKGELEAATAGVETVVTRRDTLTAQADAAVRELARVKKSLSNEQAREQEAVANLSAAQAACAEAVSQRAAHEAAAETARAALTQVEEILREAERRREEMDAREQCEEEKLAGIRKEFEAQALRTEAAAAAAKTMAEEFAAAQGELATVLERRQAADESRQKAEEECAVQLERREYLNEEIRKAAALAAQAEVTNRAKLERTRELDEREQAMREEISELQLTHVQETALAEKLAGELSQMRAELRSLQAEQAKVSAVRTLHTRECDDLLARREGLATEVQKLEELQERTAAQEAQERTVAAALAELQRSHAELTTRKDALDAELKTASGELRAARESLTETQTCEDAAALELENLRVAFAAQSSRKDLLDADTKRAASALADVKAALQTQESRAGELAELETRVVARREEFRTLEAGHAAKAEALQLQADRAAEELTRAGETLRQFQTQEKSASTRLGRLNEACTSQLARKEGLEADVLRLSQMAESLTPAAVETETPQRIVRALIKIVDLTDTANSFVKRSADSEVSMEQFSLLRESLIGLLAQMDVEEVVIPPGAVVDGTLRGRIQVARHVDGPGEARVESTLTPGYVRRNGDGKTVFIRKPEVVTACGEAESPA